MTAPEQARSSESPSTAWLAHYEEAAKRRRARGPRMSRHWARKNRRSEPV